MQFYVITNFYYAHKIERNYLFMANLTIRLSFCDQYRDYITPERITESMHQLHERTH